MVRRRWLIAKLALLGVLALLVFPGAGSALEGSFTISLTSSGPSPAALGISAGYAQISFKNTDTVAHTVSFANGRNGCSADIAPSDHLDCASPFYVGDYVYTVDGTTEGHVTVAPVERRISLQASGHRIKRGSFLQLHGRLEAWIPGGPPSPGVPQPVLILSRPDRHHPYHRVAVVQAKVVRTGKFPSFGELVWRLHTRPKASTVYTAEAVYKPAGGRVWKQAFSKPFRVSVRR